METENIFGRVCITSNVTLQQTGIAVVLESKAVAICVKLLDEIPVGKQQNQFLNGCIKKGFLF